MGNKSRINALREEERGPQEAAPPAGVTTGGHESVGGAWWCQGAAADGRPWCVASTVAGKEHGTAVRSSTSRCHLDTGRELLWSWKGLQKVQGCPHSGCCPGILCTGLRRSCHTCLCVICASSDFQSHSPWETGGLGLVNKMCNHFHGPFLACG